MIDTILLLLQVLAVIVIGIAVFFACMFAAAIVVSAIKSIIRVVKNNK